MKKEIKVKREIDKAQELFDFLYDNDDKIIAYKTIEKAQCQNDIRDIIRKLVPKRLYNSDYAGSAIDAYLDGVDFVDWATVIKEYDN